MTLFQGKPLSAGSFTGLLRRLGGESRTPSVPVPTDERFREAFEQSPLGLAYVARDGHSLQVNNRFRELTGYTREQLFRTSFRDLTHPEDALKEARQIKELVSGEIASYKIDKRIIQKDGSYHWINVLTSVVRTPAGDVDYFVHLIEEVKERRGAEIWRGADQVLVAVVDAIDELAIIRTDSLGTIQSWNRGAARVFGYLRDEVVGRPRRILYRDNDNWQDRPSEHLDAAATKGRTESEDWRVTKAGTHLWLRSTISAVRQDGRLVGFMEVLRHPDLGRSAPVAPVAEPARVSTAAVEELRRAKDALERELGARERTIDSLRAALEDVKGVAEETMNELRIMTDALRKEMDRRRGVETELKEVQEALALATRPGEVPVAEVEEEPELLLESELLPSDTAAETWEVVGDLPVTELLVALAAADRTGTFTIRRGRDEREIFFDRGKILSCATNNPAGFLAQRLIALEYVTDEQRQRALEIQQQTGLALGRILVILGFIDEPSLLHVMREKMEEELRETFAWHDARYCFVEEATPSLQIVPLPIDVISFIVHELHGTLPLPAEVPAIHEVPAPPPIDIVEELTRAIEPILQSLPVAVGELPDVDVVESYIGSVTGKSRKYHRLTCIVADRIVARNRITFDSRTTAENGGFQRCALCLKPTLVEV
jgi:PAS domain S-box-containing protein